MKQPQLSNKHIDEIKKILIKEKVAKHVIEEGINGLIKKWTDFVKECENGYSLTINDYTNDLDIRTILETVLDKMKDLELIKEIKSVLKTPDEKFKKLLVERNKSPIFIRTEEKYVDKGKYFWYWGIIKNAKGELLKDLKKEKLFSYYK